MSQSDCQSRTSPERLGSAASSLGIVPFGFHSKTQYDANETLIQIRSENYEPKEPIKDNNIWKRPPPDFRPQIFAPKPPKRNSRESMQPWNYGTIPGQREIIKRERQKVIPHILLPLKEDRTRFVTTGRIMRPFTAKKKFVTEGMYNPGPFADIREHDFRGYPPLKKLGLSEFLSKYDKDPYNLKFHSERLDIIHGERFDKATDRDIKGQQMAPPKTPQPPFDSQLILDREKWPIKPGEYTRFRLRHRPAKSAFMERVSNTLESRWAKEKMEETLATVSS
ncbi:uncharacterized protein LOC127728473 isoform X2 [Mytilus californianus]|uniref:uncharacterized protein LOC127728473 isoform X2 n=1 Tax=Mytilus californianus TaxID=6549 RepID=UPI0022473F6C|nr:uncharacterized protein LOC127728473 isoform X2 [Mytilus californianus]